MEASYGGDRSDGYEWVTKGNIKMEALALEFLVHAATLLTVADRSSIVTTCTLKMIWKSKNTELSHCLQPSGATDTKQTISDSDDYWQKCVRRTT